ncbi:MAG: DNA polymerase/3'-5' exonuclease PolX [archaeon]|nr:DNA polymerase/3'-5' exonuclease PolX [archaeon]
MKNLEVAKLLYNIADILELQDVQWKPQAYRKAAQSIESLGEDIAQIHKKGKLEQIPGVGKNIAEKIAEFLEKGKLQYYDQLKKQVKVDIEGLNEIPSLGPKRIKILYKKLGIKTVKDLEKAIRNKALQRLEGFGEKIEQSLLEGIEIVKHRPKRFLYIHAMPIVEEIKIILQKQPFISKVEVAGSFRRGKETIGDLDFLVVSSQPEKVMNIFTSIPDVKKVLAKGLTKGSVILSNGMQVDLRIVHPGEFGSALLYFIGNKEHNVALRKLALKRGYSLSEYGLFTVKEKKWVAGKTEEEVYKKLKLQYIPPEIRRDQGEIDAALKKKIPTLIEEKDVKGMFHNHTIWSDGANSLLEMAKKAESLKWKFISFNDHFGNVGITKPLDERRLVKYLAEIEKVRKKVGLKVFSGVEIDILKDGTLPLPAKKLKELDVVIASVHTSLKMSSSEMTKRICSALENYPINILGHPTDRLLNERQPLQFNLETVFETAKKSGVFLEVNGSPSRMDLSGELIKQAKDIGCKFAFGSDAHDLNHLEFSKKSSILMARRGWLETKDVLNSWTFPRIEKMLKR